LVIVSESAESGEPQHDIAAYRPFR